MPEEPVGRIAGYHRRFRQKYPLNQLRRQATTAYNCYALVFANRRPWMGFESVQPVMDDGGFRPLVYGEEPIAGDIVVYFDETGTEVLHVGVILEMRSLLQSGTGPPHVPLVLSKWGSGPEYVHIASHCEWGSNYRILTERPLEHRANLPDLLG
jgi:hypothetical protein